MCTAKSRVFLKKGYSTFHVGFLVFNDFDLSNKIYNPVTDYVGFIQMKIH